MSAMDAADGAVQALVRSRDVVLDIALAALFAAGSVFEVLSHADSTVASTAPVLIQTIAVIAGAAPLAFRRIRPFGALVAVVVIMGAFRVTLDTPIVLWSLGVIVVATYSSARHARSPLHWWSIAPPFALIGVYSLVIPGFFNLNDLETDLAVMITAWGIGLILRSWDATRQALHESLIEVQAAEARRMATAVSGERDRIARELHDVVAHCVTVMVVQAGSARLTLHSNPGASEHALRAVEASGREALAEMRRMLGLLHDDSSEALEPQPSLVQADRLVAQFADTGMRIDYAVEGVPRTLPIGVDVSAYRILQESLTNVIAHASDSAVIARVRYLPDAVEVEVRNGPGTDSGRSSGGYGVAGMRERARLFGGNLDSGRTDDGGFHIAASLPAEAAA